MAQIAGLGNTVPRRPPSRPAPRPVPVRRVAPAKSPVFGPIGPAGRAQAQGGAPVVRARQQAGRSERQAANRLPSRPGLPIVPALNSYTPQQANEVRRRVGPAVAHAVLNEGHAQGYINEAAQRERQGGSAADASTPFARLLRNSNAQERQTLHTLERLGGADAVNNAVEGARQKEIAAQVNAAVGLTPGVPHAQRLALGRDLERRGYLTRDHLLGIKSLPEVGGYLERNPLTGATSTPYHGPTKIGVASTLSGTNVPLPPQGSFLNRALTDIADTTTGALPSFVKSWENTGKAALGNRKPLEQEASQIGHAFLHPDFHNHPVTSVLQYAPIPALVGRGIGGALRSGAFGEAAARAGSTEREPLVAYTRDGADGHQAPPPIQIPRSYSGNSLGKAAQRVGEGVRRKLGQDPNQATGARLKSVVYGGSEAGHALADRGVIPDVLAGAVKPGLVDKEAASLESQRRLLANAHVHAMPSDREALSQAIPLITEGVVRRPDTLVADLEAEVKRLTDAQSRFKLTGRDLADNQEQVRQVTGVLGLAKSGANFRPAFQAAAEHIQRHDNGLVQELARLGGMHEDALRAKYQPIAIAHGGAVTAEEATGRYQQAVGEFRQARRDLAAAADAKNSAAAREAGQRLTQARDAIYRWGPYGRDRMAPVERAAADARAAGQRAKQAEGRHVQAVRARDRLVGQQQVQRMTRPGEAYAHDPNAARPENMTSGQMTTEQRQVAMGRADALIESRKAERDTHNAAWRQAREAHQQARRNLGPPRSGLRKANGDPFSTAELHDLAMRETGGRGVGFLTQRPTGGFRGAVRSRLVGGRAGTTYQHRSGSAFQTGTYDRSYAALQRQVYETANRVSSHRSANALANRFGVGRFDTEADAVKAADNFNFTAGGERNPAMEMVPWHIGPEPTTHLTDTGAARPEDPHRAFDETPQGRYALMPKMVAERLGEHDLLSHQGRSIMNAYTSAWRNAQLFTSPRWLVGNPQENMIRVAAEGANPAGMIGRGSSFHIGQAQLDRWKSLTDASDEHLHSEGLLAANAPPGAGEMIRQVARAHVAAYDAGSHYGSIAVNAIRQGDKLPSEMPAGQAQGVRFWRGWRQKLGAFQGRMERNAKLTVLGKIERRQMSGFMGKVGKLNDEQVKIAQAAADGKLDPNVAAAHTDRVMRAMGNWSTLTPKVRKAVQRYTPFGLWWLNSMKFLGRLPFDHPFITAATIAAVRGTEGQRKDPTAAFLAGGAHVKLPVIGGATVNPTYYSPGGVLIDPFKTAADMWMPQMSNLLTTALGVSAFPDKRGNLPALQAPGGPTGKGQSLNLLQRLEALANVPVQGVIPGARQAQTILEAGGSPFATANLVTDAMAAAGAGRQQTRPGSRRTPAQVAAKLLFPTRITLDKSTAGGGGANLSPEQQAVMRAYQRTQGATSSSGLTAEQQAVLKAYQRTHK